LKKKFVDEVLPPNSCITVYRVDQDLSMDHLTNTRTEVPVYSKLLAIWSAGAEKVWNTERVVANYQTHQPLSSVGRARIRSGSVGRD
jgi:hypothetical protein